MYYDLYKSAHYRTDLLDHYNHYHRFFNKSFKLNEDVEFRNILKMETNKMVLLKKRFPFEYILICLK